MVVGGRAWVTANDVLVEGSVPARGWSRGGWSQLRAWTVGVVRRCCRPCEEDWTGWRARLEARPRRPTCDIHSKRTTVTLAIPVHACIYVLDNPQQSLALYQ